MMRLWSISIGILLLIGSCQAGKKGTKGATAFSPRIGFYNVENLFDLENDPKKFDDDFTPEGRQKWDQKRYQKKLSNLHRVIKGMNYPALLGLCEVENMTVLKALADSCKTTSGQYQIAHFESLDFRGIDVALLYDPLSFKVSNSKRIRSEFPDEDGKPYTSRDILQVKGMYLQKYPLYIFVNHWPSRRGGLAKSEPKRLLVAANLKKAVAEVLANDPDAHIIIMGDFNDEPSNKSIEETLGAAAAANPAQANQLYNCSYALDAQGEGTYNYRGNWNQLDQIIASGNLLNGKKGLKLGKAVNFQREWMMYQDERDGAKPSRTYGGPNYYGGYSDHLPVYIDLGH